MNSISKNCHANLAYAKQIMADVDDASMAERPMGLNSPCWILVHLATAADYAAKLLGSPGVCPEAWNEIGDPSKKPLANRSDYPNREELFKHFEAAYNHGATLLDNASDDLLQSPQKLGFFEKELPTVQDMAAFLLVSHLAIHLGQLSAWRRAMGKAPLF